MAKSKKKEKVEILASPFNLRESDVRTFAEGGRMATALGKRLKFTRIKVSKANKNIIKKSKPTLISSREMSIIRSSSKVPDALIKKIESTVPSTTIKKSSKKKGPEGITLKDLKQLRLGGATNKNKAKKNKK